MSDFDADNRAQTDRIRRLAGLADGALTAGLADGWTVGAVLAHLAFYDRFVVQRWRAALASGALVPLTREMLVDFVSAANAGGLPQWRALPPSWSARDAREAAEEFDDFVAALPQEALDQVRGRGLMVDRKLHRAPHLDEVEAALGMA